MRASATWVLLLLATLLSVAPAQDSNPESATERIHRFGSDIQVLPDGTVRVTEQIRVTAQGDVIQRGIYRDFPTVYDGPFFTRVEVPFRVIEVTRDGNPEPYHTEGLSSGTRVYIGDASKLLEPGVYTYQIKYETGSQIGFFENHDELYWNVTGNGWVFPVEHVEASVELPPGVPSDSLQFEAFTGYSGESGRDYSASLSVDGKVEFETTRTLDPYEGLTIVVQFPKGFVAQPTSEEEWNRFAASNKTAFLAALGTLVVFLYYLVAWVLVGKDPKRGVITTLYHPPINLDPAEMRFIREMGYDERCFTVALIHLAVKGHLIISEKDGTYTLTRSSDNEDNLSRTEASLLRTLLPSGSINLDKKRHGTFRRAISDLQLKLKIQSEGRHFRSNRKWMIPGLALTVVTLIASTLMGQREQIFASGFILLWLTFWTIGVYALASTVFQGWKEVLLGSLTGGHRAGKVVTTGCITLFALPFFLGELLGLWFLTATTSVLILPFILTLAGINYFFFHWLKQPTGAGRLMMDKIEGFRRYLAAVEAGPLAVAHPAGRTPELFESYLPYAVALGVENEWADQFTDVLEASSQSEASGSASRNLSWYRGSHLDTSRLAAFSSGLTSSLGSAISTASTPPGSRSGGSGGGSSGGGGGGGGGGGW